MTVAGLLSTFSLEDRAVCLRPLPDADRGFLLGRVWPLADSPQVGASQPIAVFASNFCLALAMPSMTRLLACHGLSNLPVDLRQLQLVMLVEANLGSAGNTAAVKQSMPSVTQLDHLPRALGIPICGH